MPGKSRHGRGKHYSRKSKTMMRQGTAPPVSQASATAPEANRPSAPAAPAPRAAVAAGKANVTTYPFIASELRRIAVLAGIIIVILVVLAIVLT